MNEQPITKFYDEHCKCDEHWTPVVDVEARLDGFPGIISSILPNGHGKFIVRFAFTPQLRTVFADTIVRF